MRTLTRRLAGAALSLASVAGLFVATAPPAEALDGCANHVYSYSLTTKTCVVYLQRLVNEAYAFDAKYGGHQLGTKRVLDDDGKYGDKTRSAIRNIQEHLMLFKTNNYNSYAMAKVDGQTGVQTWTFLCDGPVSDSWWKAGCDKLDTPYLHTGIA